MKLGRGVYPDDQACAWKDFMQIVSICKQVAYCGRRKPLWLRAQLQSDVGSGSHFEKCKRCADSVCVWVNGVVITFIRHFQRQLLYGARR